MNLHTFLIRRTGIATGAPSLQAVLNRLYAFEDDPPFAGVRWLHTYVLREGDGRFGLACVCQADSAGSLVLHAEQTAAPAAEINEVTSVSPMRALAPTMLYMVRRRGGWADAEALAASAAEAREVGEQMIRSVAWLHSYVLRERDGMLGTACLYQATSAEALRGHAILAGLPADEITPVVGRVVYRDAPAVTQPLAGTLA